MRFTKEEINIAINIAYKKQGGNAYFSEGFEDGITFAFQKMNEKIARDVQNSVFPNEDITEKSLTEILYKHTDISKINEVDYEEIINDILSLV